MDDPTTRATSTRRRSETTAAGDSSINRSQRVAFAEATVALADAGPHGDEARHWATAAAAALVRLGASGDRNGLSDLLRPNPVDAHVTWTVACYQIGDLTPTELRDFADPSEAVGMLASCPHPSHVAAELLASTEGGLRWSALVRTGDAVTFRLPSGDSCGEATDPAELAVAVGGWERRLGTWARRDGAAGPIRQAPAGDDNDVDDAVDRLLEALDRRLDDRKAGADALSDLGARLERLEALAEDTAALLDRVTALEAARASADADAVTKLRRLEALVHRHAGVATDRLDLQHAEAQLLTARVEADHADLARATDRMATIEARLDDVAGALETIARRVAFVEGRPEVAAADLLRPLLEAAAAAARRRLRRAAVAASRALGHDGQR